MLDYTKNIIRNAEQLLDKLEDVRFSRNEVVLYQEKENLAEKYKKLIARLRDEKETILRQIEKKIMVVTPLRQKTVKNGYCYFCDISVSAVFSYKLRAEEQSALRIDITEGAVFCSQQCLLSYCKEYKNREKMRQDEEKKIKEKIENDRRVVTEIQERIDHLTERINKLERRERELELLPSENLVEKENNGFWHRLGQKLGLAKKPNPLSKLEMVRKRKEELKFELERSEEERKNTLMILSLDEQKEQQRKKLEENILLEKERIATKSKENEEFE
ncbi:MAG: hypothetical protein NY202_04275 [Mollicutes bacterium UO1]